MPCMGPDLEHAREWGRKTGIEILEKMLDDHTMWGPMPSITKLKSRQDETEWNTAKENFVKAVEELFVLDGIYSFVFYY